MSDTRRGLATRHDDHVAVMTEGNELLITAVNESWFYYKSFQISSAASIVE